MATPPKTQTARCPECEGKIRRLDWSVRFTARGKLWLMVAVAVGAVGAVIAVAVSALLLSSKGAVQAVPVVFAVCMAPCFALGGNAYRHRERVASCRACGWSGIDPLRE